MCFRSRYEGGVDFVGHVEITRLLGVESIETGCGDEKAELQLGEACINGRNGIPSMRLVLESGGHSRRDDHDFAGGRQTSSCRRDTITGILR
jgi:hypothetical protein